MEELELIELHLRGLASNNYVYLLTPVPGGFSIAGWRCYGPGDCDSGWHRNLSETVVGFAPRVPRTDFGHDYTKRTNQPAVGLCPILEDRRGRVRATLMEIIAVENVEPPMRVLE